MGPLATFWRSQRELGCAANHVALLIGKHPLKSRRVDDPIALIRRHRTKIADGRGDLALTVRRKLAVLSEKLACFPLLLRRQVLPGFHAVEHLQLLLRRQVGEVLQTLAQDLLAIRRQATECRIVLKGALLFRGRKVFVLTQPVAGVSLLSCGLIRTGYVLLRYRRPLLRRRRARLRGGHTRWWGRLTMLLPSPIQSQARMGEGCEYG